MRSTRDDRLASVSAPTKGERTKQSLIDATGLLMRKHGYHGTGLAAIVEASGAPRGSLYFHFPGGKDELVIAAIGASATQWRERLFAAVDEAPDLGTAIRRAVDIVADELEASGWELGCPVAAVALEEAPPVVQRAIADHFTKWERGIAERVTRLGIPTALASHVATVALAAIEGALLLARVQRSRQPLTTVAITLATMATSFRTTTTPR